ncbi:MAG: enoyl-CoA hydratase-related protein [Bacillota bacterium]|nr:enoyl-CoA hydratase-related protein [Bacillota bacterium]
MDYQQIKYEVEDRILTITLNRPDRLNAYTEILRAEMIDAFDHADADDNIRAIIVTGEGRAFCAGMDLGDSSASFDYTAIAEDERRGVLLDACSSWILPRIVGISQALEWAMTGRVFFAQEAFDKGLVSKVVPPEEVLPAARTIALEIAQNSAPVSVALTR